MNAPAQWADEARFQEAAAAFRGFFNELREAFVERETLFTQLELALLCREHVLIIGPPGTAKSAIASAVLGRIVDAQTLKPSLFSKQLAENTVQTDLIGPVDFKVLTETGRTEHLTDEGMLGSVHAFLDEVFDGRDMLLRSILNVLHERELKHGRKVTPGRCECAVMTSNRYLSEVVQRSPETLQAFADRISFISFAPKSFARRSSRGQMLHRAQTGQRPALHARLTLQQLDALQEWVEAVQVPPLVAEGMEELAESLERELLAQVARLPDYVPTKYFSQRSMVKALWVLKALVVRDRLYRRPERPLVAEPADLEGLRHFFLLGGPTEQDLEALFKNAADPRERAQLDIIRVENKAFSTAWGRLAPSLQSSVDRELAELKLGNELDAAQQLPQSWTPAVAITTVRALRARLLPGPRHPDNRKVLLRAAEALALGLETRLLTRIGAEGRTAVALLESLGAALDFVSRVPELQPRVPPLAAAAGQFSHTTLAAIALGAEAAEFDDKLSLEAVVSLAGNLSEELQRATELGQLATQLGGADGGLRAQVNQCRERTALALRRRATRALQQPAAARKGDPLQQLALDGRRLRELEATLVSLSESHRGLRAQFLAPLAETWARAVLAPPFERLSQVHLALQSVNDELSREGADPHLAIRACAPELEKRLLAWAQRLGEPPPRDLDAERAGTGELHQQYRRELAQHPLDGESTALGLVSQQLQAAGAAPLPAALFTSMQGAELALLKTRFQFLANWWLALSPALERARTPDAADAAFDLLVKSRFPQLVTREAELLRLEAAAERLSAHPQAPALRSSIAELQADFARVSRQVLDARAPRK